MIFAVPVWLKICASTVISGTGVHIFNKSKRAEGAVWAAV
jgi:hypothetical protein